MYQAASEDAQDDPTDRGWRIPGCESDVRFRVSGSGLEKRSGVVEPHSIAGVEAQAR